MLTTKKQFLAVIASISGICLCFMLTIISRRYKVVDTDSISLGPLLSLGATDQKVPDSNLHIKERKDILDFIHKQCKKYGKVTVAPGEAAKPRRMIIAKNWRNHRMIYSSNPKTGSSSYKRWYNRIQGDTRPYDEIKHVHQMGKYGKVQDLFDLAEEKMGRPATLIEAVESMFKVTVVRNPITKLLSGFRDKVQRRSMEGIKEPMLEINPNLNINSTDAEKYAAFVEAVVIGKLRNHHYTPQWNKMKICDFPYDMILQTETTNQQIHVVQEHTNTSEYDFPGSRSDIGKDDISTLQRTQGYYSLIGPELMDKLYNYFLWDFVLMGYTKLDSPNFPYLDFDQDIDKVFGHLIENKQDIVTEEPGTEPTIDPTVKK